MKHQAILLLAIASQCLPLPAWAIVDIDNAIIRHDNPAFEIKLNLSLSGKNGNSDSQTSSAGGRLQWAKENSISFVVFDTERGDSSGVLSSRNSFIHTRHIARLNDQIDYELFAQMESNEFTRLQLRWLVGGGLRRDFMKNHDGHSLYLGAGAFHATENIEDAISQNEEAEQRTLRVNIYMFNEHQISSSTLVKNTLYYQPDIEAREDYRWLEKFRLEVSMTEILSLVVALDITYDSEPPQGVRKRDLSYMTGLQFKY